MRYIGALIAALLLAACSPQAQAPAATPTAVATPTAAQQDPVIIFHRTGGFAGVDNQYRVFADGRVEVKGGVDRMIGADRVARALADLEERGFFALEDEYGLDGTCNDCFTYEISARDEGGALKTVTAVGEAPETPDEVKEMIARLNVLLPRST